MDKAAQHFQAKALLPMPAMGHGAATWKAVEPVGMNCGEGFHGKECTRLPKCANCAEEHPAVSRQCFLLETLNIKKKP